MELSVFADVDVRELLCPSPPADVGVIVELSTGDVGELGSCSFVRFFLRNPRVGIRAQVTWMRREMNRGGSVVVPPEIGQQADSPAQNGNLIKACGIAIGAPILWEISCADLWVGSLPRGSSLTRSDACSSRYAGYCGARTSYRLRWDMGWLGYGETLN